MSKKNKTQERHDKLSTSRDSARSAAAATLDAVAPSHRSLSSADYEAQLHLLQVELVMLQRHYIRCQDGILMLEGRDAAASSLRIASRPAA